MTQLTRRALGVACAIGLTATGALTATAPAAVGIGATRNARAVVRRPGAHRPRRSPTPADPLRVVSSTRIDARIVELTMSTPAIDGPVHVRVMLPTGYAATRRRYPVIYLLHGSTGNASTWTTAPYQAESLTANLPVIVVMPDGGTNGEYTNWYNGDRGGPPEWETFHVDQLVPWIDAHYRTIARRQDRAITGVSMGGLGTMEYASRHPDIFGVAASMSGAVSTASPVGLASIEVNEEDYGSEPVGTIYGPYATDQLNYRAHSPTDLAINLADTQLWISTYNGVPGSSCAVTGDGDVLLEEGVHEMSLELDAALTKQGIPHVFDFLGDGTHSIGCFNHQLSLVLPWIMNAFAHPRPAPSAVTYTTDLPSYEAWEWSVAVHRQVDEFSTLVNASAHGFALEGSGTATVSTPPDYRPGARYRITITPSVSGEPGASGPETGCFSTAVATQAPSVTSLLPTTTESCAPFAVDAPNATSAPWQPVSDPVVETVTATRAGALVIAVPLGASNTTQEFADGNDQDTEIYRTAVTVRASTRRSR